MVIIDEAHRLTQSPDPGLEVRQRPRVTLPAAAHRHPGAERPARALQPGDPAQARGAGHLRAVPARVHGARDRRTARATPASCPVSAGEVMIRTTRASTPNPVPQAPRGDSARSSPRARSASSTTTSPISSRSPIATGETSRARGGTSSSWCCRRRSGQLAAAAVGTLRRLATTLSRRSSRRLAPRSWPSVAAAIEHPTRCEALLDVYRDARARRSSSSPSSCGTLDFLAARSAARGLTHGAFHGGLRMRGGRRRSTTSAVRRPVLISTEAGGEGRNLQFCHRVVNYDLPWNPMKVEQRIGRDPPPGAEARRLHLQLHRGEHGRVLRARDPGKEDPHVRARDRRDGHDPGPLSRRRPRSRTRSSSCGRSPTTTR